jgi:Flp pilus assembly protein TadG
MSLEIVLAFPIFLLFLALFVGAHRYTQSRQLLQEASAASARAASLAFTPAQARTDAHQIAADILDQAGLTCTGLHVSTDVTRFTAGGQVTVSVRCTATLATLTHTGLPQTVTLTSTSTAPLDPYRAYQQ